MGIFQGTMVFEGQRESLGYEQVTSIGSAKALTVPTGTKLILIQPETQAIRWRDDGTSPTASVGMVIAAGDTLVYTGSKPASIKVIETQATAKVNVTYFA